jgi:Protein of unknown function (DUF1800)
LVIGQFRRGTFTEIATSKILNSAQQHRKIRQQPAFLDCKGASRVKQINPLLYTFEDAAHLMRRTCFGGSVAQIRALQKLGPIKAVEMMLQPLSDDVAPNPFDLRQAFLNKKNKNVGIGANNALQGWWVHRMVHSPRPFLEKLTLFWHGHFATEMRKVNNPFALQKQNEIFRNLGLGRFEILTLAVAKDPAMIWYLDNFRNVKGKPNENFARELMELFTMGVHGGYTEKDVLESARAFTGWNLKRGNENQPEEFETYMNPQYVFNAKAFDNGEKTYLGQKGKFVGEDIVRIACAHPSTAKFIITKLWKFYVADEIPSVMLESLVGTWNSSQGDIATVIKAILTSEAFYARENRLAVVKSPADYVIGTLRALEAKLAPEQCLGAYTTMARMGQALFNPPNVKGWDGGTSWVSDTTILNRLAFIGGITQNRVPANVPKGQAQPAVNITLPKGSSFDESFEVLLQTFLGRKTDGVIKRVLEQYAAGKYNKNVLIGMTYLVLASPQYHLA